MLELRILRKVKGDNTFEDRLQWRSVNLNIGGGQQLPFVDVPIVVEEATPVAEPYQPATISSSGQLFQMALENLAFGKLAGFTELKNFDVVSTFYLLGCNHPAFNDTTLLFDLWHRQLQGVGAKLLDTYENACAEHINSKSRLRFNDYLQHRGLIDTLSRIVKVYPNVEEAKADIAKGGFIIPIVALGLPTESCAWLNDLVVANLIAEYEKRLCHDRSPLLYPLLPRTIQVGFTTTPVVSANDLRLTDIQVDTMLVEDMNVIRGRQPYEYQFRLIGNHAWSNGQPLRKIQVHYSMRENFHIAVGDVATSAWAILTEHFGCKV